MRSRAEVEKEINSAIELTQDIEKLRQFLLILMKKKARIKPGGYIELYFSDGDLDDTYFFDEIWRKCYKEKEE